MHVVLEFFLDLVSLLLVGEKHLLCTQYNNHNVSSLSFCIHFPFSTFPLLILHLSGCLCCSRITYITIRCSGFIVQRAYVHFCSASSYRMVYLDVQVLTVLKLDTWYDTLV